MTLITIVTHDGAPQGVADDRLLALAIGGAGATVRCLAWTDSNADWSVSPVTVVRSTWDYHLKPAAWFAWLDTVALQTRVVNPPALIRWNSDKRYLLDLQSKGIPIVPSRVVEPGEDVQSSLEGCGWRDVVIKPVVGASSFGAKRFREGQMPVEAVAHLEALHASGAALIQPYQSAIEHARERSLVYIDGTFSHAFTKPGFYAGLGDEKLQGYDPVLDERYLAERVLGQLVESPIVARIDMLPSRNGPVLMEAELVEPQLALHLGAGSADRLAASLVRRTGD